MLITDELLEEIGFLVESLHKYYCLVPDRITGKECINAIGHWPKPNQLNRICDSCRAYWHACELKKALISVINLEEDNARFFMT